ncbi:MAG: MmgE/PrpD family protein [Chloroflexota bacterium]
MGKIDTVFTHCAVEDMNWVNFVHDLQWDDIPETSQHMARRCLLDTLGVAIGGRQTELSRIIHDFAAAVYGGNDTRLWQNGRFVSAPGAALANGMTIDSLDMHDGYQLCKGHAGAALVPAVIATLENDTTGKELLTSLVIGYEIACRAGVALHATVTDYHTSGAWNALGCAVITARRMGLTAEQTRHAVGIAEYHGPRSQMMRCIDFPTMVKDGSGWGAMTGISAALMAAQGFTGAPAITIEADEVASLWDLGERWLMAEQYFKSFAVCYWAQPSIAASLGLQSCHNLDIEDISAIRVYTFHEATRLACHRPANTEEAQYSLPFPVGAALVHGHIGGREISGDELFNPAVLRLSDMVELVEGDEFNQRFPTERLCRVEIDTQDGQTFRSPETRSPWDETAPATDAQLLAKFRRLAEGQVKPERAEAIEKAAWNCDELSTARELAELMS